MSKSKNKKAGQGKSRRQESQHQQSPGNSEQASESSSFKTPSLNKNKNSSAKKMQQQRRDESAGSVPSQGKASITQSSNVEEQGSSNRVVQQENQQGKIIEASPTIRKKDEIIHQASESQDSDGNLSIDESSVEEDRDPILSLKQSVLEQREQFHGVIEAIYNEFDNRCALLIDKFDDYYGDGTNPHSRKKLQKSAKNPPKITHEDNRREDKESAKQSSSQNVNMVINNEEHHSDKEQSSDKGSTSKHRKSRKQNKADKRTDYRYPAKQLTFDENTPVVHHNSSNTSRDPGDNSNGSSSPNNSDDESSQQSSSSSEYSSSSSFIGMASSGKRNVASHTATQNTIRKARKEMFSPSSRKVRQQKKSDKEELSSILPVINKNETTTIVGRLALSADKPQHQLMYVRPPPSYDNIQLHKLNLKYVVAFLEKVTEYQLSVGIRVPVPQLISKPVREQLISLYRGLTLHKFYALSTAEIQEILLTETRPKSCNSFLSELNRNVHFPPVSDTLNPQIPADFRILYNDHLLVYMAKFLKWYEMMAENNTVNVPPLKNRDGGSLKIFLDKIPFDYGIRVFRTMSNSKGDKFRDIYHFMKRFTKVSFSHYDWSERNRVVEEHVNSSFQASRNNKSNFKVSYGGDTHNRNSSFKRSYPDGNKNNSSGYNKFSRIHHISGDAADPDTDAMDSTGDNGQDNNYSAHDSNNSSSNEARNDADNKEDDIDSIGEQIETLMYIDNNRHSSNNHGNDNNRFKTFHSNNNTSKQPNTNNFSSNRPSSHNNSNTKKAPNGCFRMLFKGSCDLGDKCTFSHSPHNLQESYGYYANMLANSRYKPRDSRPPVRNNLTHISAAPNNNNMDNTNNAETHALQMLSYVHNVDPWSLDLDTLCQSLYLHEVPEASIMHAVYKEGLITVSKTDKLLTITVPHVLFDTGALHSSYISVEFYNKHRQLLQPFVKPQKGCVKLADNKTFVNTSEVISLPLSFRDSKNIQHEATITLPIFPSTGKNDIILGLPAIVFHFSALHIDMIQEAVNALVKSQEPKHIPESLSTIVDDSIVTPVVSPYVNDVCFTVIDNDVLISNPWATMDGDAIEDLETPLPSSFPEVLHFMEMSHEEAVSEYLGQLAQHVSPEFRQYTEIYKLLIDKGVLVFVPKNWDGINGIELFELTFKDNFPESVKPKARAVNPKLFAAAHEEFHRLCQYFYEPSTSSVASCLVIAPKATKPFIRFCGDYVYINKFIVVGHYPIPNVQYALEKIIRFKIFLDFDLVNAFHQIKVGPLTSARLSVQTAWGQVQPKFMPEGIGPASGKLQQVVYEIFREFEEWSIIIFDNLLVLAHDYQDAYNKVDIILTRCIERNVFLKFSKTWLGFTEVNFFGYVCTHKSYKLSDERKEAITSIPFPKNVKQMQSFLGSALFFKNFIPNFSGLTAQLNEMTHKSFNWDQKTWKVDYIDVFNQLKKHLLASGSLYFPNYDLDWILRTDASVYGVGAVLLQVCNSPDPEKIEPEYQPISFVSKKFSTQATKWSTIEQEAYAIYYAVHHFAYYLRCKPFILETDHNNLLWMESSTVPKIVRWRVLLQSFTFVLRHIAGTRNTVADMLSRIHCPPDEVVHALFNLFDNRVEPDPSPKVDVNSALKLVHSGRNLHPGTRRTWLNLNACFPGHKIPYKVVEDFVSTCPICQKDRLRMNDSLQPLVRHLKPPHARSIVGVDTLTVTPVDQYGNQYLVVVVNLFTKLVGLYPVKTHDAISVATALFQYFCTYGLVDSLISDPGTEFLNEVVTLLLQWFGIRKSISLVDRHQSNGVEATNAQVLRLLKAIVFDERLVDRWSDPTVLPLIQYHLNSAAHSESGCIPFEATFGSLDSQYFTLPKEDPSSVTDSSQPKMHRYIQQLDTNLKLIRTISSEHQAKIAQERTEETPEGTQNKFQPGDLILFQRDPNNFLPTKLSPKYVGPYQVIQQYRNDITCRHVIMGEVKVLHVSRVKLFHGTLEEAKNIAVLDHDQYVVDSIVAHKGDPTKRTTMQFEVLFKDGTKVWKYYDTDIADTQVFEDYCHSLPELQLLLISAKEAANRIRLWKTSPIVDVKPGDEYFVDFRSYGAQWYETLPLPDKDHITYVVLYVYGTFVNKKTRTSIRGTCPVFNEKYKALTNEFIKMYGSNKNLIPNGQSIILIDKAFTEQYPSVLPTHTEAPLEP